MKEKDEVTISKSDLEALISKRIADSAMDDSEKKVRSIVRDEITSALGDFFASGDESDEGDEGDEGNGNAPGKGKSSGALESFAAFLGGN